MSFPVLVVVGIVIPTEGSEWRDLPMGMGTEGIKRDSGRGFFIVLENLHASGRFLTTLGMTVITKSTNGKWKIENSKLLGKGGRKCECGLMQYWV